VIETFTCSICGEEFTVDRPAGRPPTLCSPECKAEANRRRASAWYNANTERRKEYRVANADRIKAYNRSYYAKDPAAEVARARAWQEANPDKVAISKQRQKESGKDRERAAKMRRENPEVARQRSRATYWKNAHTYRDRPKQWAKANPDKARALWARNNRRRKAATRGATDLDPINPLDIYERDGWLCGLCGKPIDKRRRFPDRLSATLDHIVPISRGGQHVPENVQAAHYTCNSSKRDRDGVPGTGPPCGAGGSAAATPLAQAPGL
jgi:5-methylcytosine-specific restriction endonuclease McrA